MADRDEPQHLEKMMRTAILFAIAMTSIVASTQNARAQGGAVTRFDLTPTSALNVTQTVRAEVTVTGQVTMPSTTLEYKSPGGNWVTCQSNGTSFVSAGQSVILPNVVSFTPTVSGTHRFRVTYLVMGQFQFSSEKSCVVP